MRDKEIERCSDANENNVLSKPTRKSCLKYIIHQKGFLVKYFERKIFMSIIEQLYYDMVEDGTGSDSFRPKREEKKLGNRFDNLLKENNITGDKYTALWDVMYDLISYCKCDGFKNGFKLGAKFMLEVTYSE